MTRLQGHGMTALGLLQAGPSGQLCNAQVNGMIDVISKLNDSQYIVILKRKMVKGAQQKGIREMA